MAETRRAVFIRNASRLLQGHRKAAPPPPNPLDSTGKASSAQADQLQSAFFNKLPPEIRSMIYHEVVKGEVDVVHIVKKGKKQLDYVRCKGRCAMVFNFQCMAGMKDVGSELLLFLLRTCQKAYREVHDIVYSYITFDFRSFNEFILLSHTALPRTWNSIRRVHLKWHFGMRLWDGNCDPRQIHGPEWLKVWEIMATMAQLRAVHIALDAYVDNITLNPLTEVEVLTPLMKMTQVQDFVVTVSWPGDLGPSLLGATPFRLLHSADGDGLEIRDQPRYAKSESVR